MNGDLIFYLKKLITKIFASCTKTFMYFSVLLKDCQAGVDFALYSLMKEGYA